MEDEQKLQQAAEEIRKKVAKGEELVSLDQPFPEDIKSDDKNEREPATTKSPEGKDSGEPVVAGYALTDILRAPVEPPKPVKTEGHRATSNGRVAFLVGIGTLLCLLGVILLVLANAVLGIIVMILGALLIFVGVFGKIH
jgi:hypothetical protein